LGALGRLVLPLRLLAETPVMSTSRRFSDGRYSVCVKAPVAWMLTRVASPTCLALTCVSCVPAAAAMVVHTTVSKRIPSSCFSFISISPHARRISVLRVRHLPCRLRISPPPCGGYCPWVRPELSLQLACSPPALPDVLNPV